ncbi:MAG TPA: ACP S-malonyltransferase [Thermoanaerobaculia bacterium]|nr:ACP S-malonyltransferase [Thermoanaerobaculia bacterium]
MTPAASGGLARDRSAPAFLFPGQLSETVGIGRDFIEADPEARSLLERTSARCGRDLRRILLEGPEEALHENLAAQAGVYLVSTLAARALVLRRVLPKATAGYSLGNYAAMVAAGAVSYEDALEVLIAVWRETERLSIRGRMGAVVGARRELVEQVCAQLRTDGLLVWIGNVNAATQFVLTGQGPAVEAALEALTPRALNVLPLSMSWPIHSELMLPVARAIAPVVEGCRSIRDPQIPYYGPDGRAVTTGARVREILATEFCWPTLWNVTFEHMIADGHRMFLEVGPGEMLTKMARWIDRSVTCRPAGTLAAQGGLTDIIQT